MPQQPFYYGGQALIEGVMMRGREHIATAIRRPNGELEILSKPLPSIYKGKLRNAPFVRGIIVLIETLILGIQTTLHSAQVAASEEEEDIPAGVLWGSMAIALAFAVAIFFVLPLLVTRYLIDPFISSSLASNLIEGALRIGIFVAYLWLIGWMKDIKKVFAYHGAEHKTINAFEAGMPLEVDAVKSYSTAHARCGTSFTLIVMVIAILVFALLGRPVLWLSITSRIVLIPVIAAIGYEFVKFGGAHSHNPVVHTLLVPGLLMQSLTTRDPNANQLEAAIAALKKAIEADSSVVS
jgi:hypothetical protein